MSIEFVKDKETKNAFRFTASGEISGGLYLPKDHELSPETVVIVEISAKAEVPAWHWR